MVKPNTNSIRVFLNPCCSYSTGRSRWKKIKEDIHNRIGDFKYEELMFPDKATNQVSRAIEKGESIFIAAGGDGTVNLLLNALMKLDAASSVIIGGVGLGSSNDFHKPLRKDSIIKGVPVKIDFKNALLCDVIRIQYKSNTGRWESRFCLINASIGLTAEANAFFNIHHTLVKMIQRLSVDLAILYTALKTMVTYRNKRCQITMGNSAIQKIDVTNLGVIKNPHFTGSLCYDTPVAPDDGKLCANLCMSLSLPERIRMFVALVNHRFRGLPKTKTWRANKIKVESNEIFALEMDGEIAYTDSVKFSIMPKRMRCCR